MYSMSNIVKGLILAIALLGATVTPAHAAGTAASIADVIVLRPVGLMGVVAGTGVWLITAPFTYIAGTSGESYELLVERPIDFSFARPLGTVADEPVGLNTSGNLSTARSR